MTAHLPQVWISQRNERHIVAAIVTAVQRLVGRAQVFRGHLDSPFPARAKHFFDLILPHRLGRHVRHVKKGCCDGSGNYLHR